MVEHSTDVLVIGSGMAGVCAAIAAGRNGCDTTLLEMDPCLGGNGGPLLGVHISGAHSFHPYASETGIIEELELDAAREIAKTRTWGLHYNISQQWDLLLEKKLTDAGVQVLRLHQGRRAITRGQRVIGVVAQDIQHYQTKLITIRHALIDASGDGVVAADAGAAFMLGTEGKERFGERSAGSEDTGETMGTSVTALVRRCSRPVEFVMPAIFSARAAAEKPCEPLPRYPASWDPDDEFCFLWVTESGGEGDTIRDDAAIRREILYQLYSLWDNVKNHSFPGESRNWELTWVSPKSGKRESRRFVGDVVLTQTDVERATPFHDSIAYGGYGVDIHEPLGRRVRVVFHSIPPLWNFPYRAAYAKDFDNLWLAGRLMSVSHLALGTVRLMRTLAAIGQGIGTAVAMARELDCTARELGEKHIQELQQNLLRQDATILTVPNRDPADVARGATVEGTSEMRHGATRCTEYLPLDIPRGVQLWDWVGTLNTLEIYVTNTSEESKRLCLRCEVFQVNKPWKAPEDHRALEHLDTPPNRMEWGSCNERKRFETVARTETQVPPRFEGWRPLSFNPGVEMIPKDPTSDEERYNLILDPCPGVRIGMDEHHYDFALRLWQDPSDGDYHVAPNCHCFRMDPSPSYGEAGNITNGHSRRYSTNPVNAWLSDVDAPLPQSVTLRFGEAKRIRTIHVIFDTIERAYQEAPINCDQRTSGRCVADYAIAAYSGGAWRRVVEESDNHQRRRVHELESVEAEALRLTVLRVHDSTFRARVYEIRVYE